MMRQMRRQFIAEHRPRAVPAYAINNEARAALDHGIPGHGGLRCVIGYRLVRRGSENPFCWQKPLLPDSVA
jgi:hypothetical protein